MLIVMLILIKIALFRIYSDPFRQNLFENFTKNYRNTVEFCALFSLLNIYVFTMTFAYSPSKDSLGKCDNLHHDQFNFASFLDTFFNDFRFTRLPRQSNVRDAKRVWWGGRGVWVGHILYASKICIIRIFYNFFLFQSEWTLSIQMAVTINNLEIFTKKRTNYYINVNISQTTRQ